VVNNERVNRLEAIGIAGLESTQNKPFKCLFSTRCLLQHTLNNRPAVMESNLKCFIVVVMYV